MDLKNILQMIDQGDVLTHSVDLSGELNGFVYKSRKGRNHIFIDRSLSPEAARDALLHESGHVLYHTQSSNSMIGLNNPHCEVEKEADYFIKKNLLHENLDVGFPYK